MMIELEVTGGTNKTVRSNLTINSVLAGSIQIDRADFTKFTDILFADGYTVKGKAVVPMNP